MWYSMQTNVFISDTAVIGCLVLPRFYTEAEIQRRLSVGALCPVGLAEDIPSDPESQAAMPLAWGKGPDGDLHPYLASPCKGEEFRARKAAAPGHEIAGRPVIIQARGRVFALSPEAEEAGLSRGMSMGQAYAICPQADPLPYDEDLYRTAQKRVLDICATYISVIEPLSMHEVFLDLAGAGDPARVMVEIAEAVMSQVGFTCQAGAASSKLVARIAALKCEPGPIKQQSRPGAQGGTQLREKSRSAAGAPPWSPVVVPKGREAPFIAPLPLSQLWPLDEEIVEHLEALGITTIGLLQQIPAGHLAQRFGRLGVRLGEFARGIDRSPVRACYPPQEIEVRLTFADDMGDMTAVEAGLRRLAKEVADRLRSHGRSCRRIGLKLETDGGGSISQWLKSSRPLISAAEVSRAAERLLARALEPALARAKPMAPITSLALCAADVQRCAGVQLDLLGEREQERRRRERLTTVVDSAHQRFGAHSVRWAREIETPRRERMLALLLGERR
jgi:DNA polymerase-4